MVFGANDEKRSPGHSNAMEQLAQRREAMTTTLQRMEKKSRIKLKGK